MFANIIADVHLLYLAVAVLDLGEDFLEEVVEMFLFRGTIFLRV